jgi:hypothetical protein
LTNSLNGVAIAKFLTTAADTKGQQQRAHYTVGTR